MKILAVTLLSCILFSHTLLWDCLAEFVRDENEIFPIITTPLGRLQGQTAFSRTGKPYYEFKGIPYGKAQRFEVAVPSGPWEGTLDATSDGPVCPQVMYAGDQFVGREDCLFLNIYVPHEEHCRLENATVDDSPVNPLPVFATIHYSGSSASATDLGALGFNYLMDECVVVVAMNYRLGALGFLGTVDGLIPGNLGLKDQNLSLRWIQEYITHFRGDPDCVTIYGISYGGLSVYQHLASPLSQGLFHRAIASSPSLVSWGVDPQPGFRARSIGERLNCPSIENTTSLRECLELVGAEEIVRNQCPPPCFDYVKPIVELPETVQPFQTVHPAVRFRNGDFNKVPLISGFAQDEIFGLFHLPQTIDPDLIQNLNNDFEAYVPKLLVYDKQPIGDPEKDIISRKIRQFYFGDGPIGLNNAKKLDQMQSDRLIVQGNFEAVELVSKHTTVYPYVLTFKGLTNGYPVPVSTHGDDILVMFQYNGTEFNLGSIQFQFSQRYVRLMTSFAKSGEISEDEDLPWPSVIGSANSVWHQLDLTSGNNYDNYLNERRLFWQNLGLYEYDTPTS